MAGSPILNGKLNTLSLLTLKTVMPKINGHELQIVKGNADESDESFIVKETNNEIEMVLKR